MRSDHFDYNISREIISRATLRIPSRSSMMARRVRRTKLITINREKKVNKIRASEIKSGEKCSGEIRFGAGTYNYGNCVVVDEIFFVDFTY